MAESNEPDSFGWEILYSLYEKNIASKSHVVIVWCHYNLLRHGFKNAGLGEDLTLPSQSDLKETLPDGWNENFPCTLRYYFNNHLYTLIVQTADSDGDVVVNLSRPNDNKLTATTINTKEIHKTNGKLEEILPEWTNLVKRINDELIEPLCKETPNKDATAQTETTRDQYTGEIRFSGSRSYTPPLPYMPRVQPFPFRPPMGIGSSDLNPLGVGGGGMLFQPPGMGPRPSLQDPFLPHGSIPPGARFDPIMPGRGGSRPSRPQRGSYPDPDHLPPPGYDDMFS